MTITTRIRVLLASVAVGFIGAVVLPVAASAATPAFRLQPFEFVGTATECGGPAGTDTVTAKWDSSTGNPSPSIMLQKLGATSNCAAAGVDIISSLEGGPLSALNELNFDYKNGGHCGAGAPRFNVQTNQGTAFLGCAGGVQTSLGNGWTHVVFDTAELAAAYTAADITNPSTATLQDLSIIFDEGTDTPAGGTIGTPGTINIDNISVNGDVVGSPTSPLNKDDCKKDGWKTFGVFKNQGDCVSYVATGGQNPPAAQTQATMANKPTF